MLQERTTTTSETRSFDNYGYIFESTSATIIVTANFEVNIMTIKEYCLFKMSYKELKDEDEQPKTSNGVAYAEIISTLIIAAMICGTLLMTTSMMVHEREDEMSYLRGINP